MSTVKSRALTHWLSNGAGTVPRGRPWPIAQAAQSLPCAAARSFIGWARHRAASRATPSRRAVQRAAYRRLPPPTAAAGQSQLLCIQLAHSLASAPCRHLAESKPGTGPHMHAYRRYRAI